MKIARLKISNFRSIKNAELLFEGHSLLLGPNNIGKSTICEAIDLVLGPDRLSRFPPVEEFDFYNAQYLKESEVEECEEGRLPVGRKSPKEPTRMEREEHERTHYPYRSWCPHCVKSRA